MMPKAKTPRPKNRDEDPAQSRRFLDAAAAVTSDGGLSLTEAEAAFERLAGKALPPKKPPQDPEAA
jgi:hypothetical protein